MEIIVMRFNMVENYASEDDELELEDDGTTIANSGHRSTFSDYSLGKEYDPYGEPDAMSTADDKVLDFFKKADDDEEREKVMKADEDYYVKNF